MATDIPPLPEGVEKALVIAHRQSGNRADDHFGDRCEDCDSLRRAVVAALLRAKADEHDKCCDICISSAQRDDDCERNQKLRAQAAALEADGKKEKP